MKTYLKKFHYLIFVVLLNVGVFSLSSYYTPYCDCDLSNLVLKKSDWQEMNLKGKVKSIIKINYISLEWYNRLQFADYKHSIFNYEGYIVGEDCYFDNEMLEYNFLFCDIYGNIIEDDVYGEFKNIDTIKLCKSIVYGRIVDDKSMKLTPKKYCQRYLESDSINRTKEWKTIFGNDSSKIRKDNLLKYDVNGNLIEIIYQSDLNNSNKDKIIFVYNRKGMVVEKIDERYKEIYKFKYAYDFNKNLIECKHYIANKLYFIYSFKYDKNGKKMQKISHDVNKDNRSNIIFKYDEFGNNIEINSLDSKGNLYDSYFYKYDRIGNVIEYSSYDHFTKRNSNFRRYKYFYDSKSNWILKIEYDKRNFPIYVTEREIEYFD